MYYTIYKTTNLINGKYYIGKHQTEDLDDGYMGSGNLIKRAIAKYGIENFKKEILFVFDNEQEMNDKEKELVVVSEETYNLCPGGKGGFGYINIYNPHLKPPISKLNEARLQKIQSNSEFREIMREVSRKGALASQIWKRNTEFVHPKPFLGMKHSEETKAKMSQSKKGQGSGKTNSQYGTMWITNGVENKKVRKDELISSDWKMGRTPKL